MADDAGALLVRSGLVTSSALDGARARAVEAGGTVGEQLVIGGIVTDAQLTEFYTTRLLVPQVNPNTLARLPAKIVAVIPNQVAVELRVIPVSLDAENHLTVAMSDPSDRHAVDQIALLTGSYVIRAVATQMQIAWCLAHYYGHITHLGQRLLQADPTAKPEGAVEPVAAPRARQRGITGEVEAMRHRGLVPGQATTAAGASVIVDRNDGDDEDSDDRDDLTEPSDGTVERTPRPRSISGEIRAPRASSIKPPLPEDTGPIITIEADDRDSGPEISVIQEPQKLPTLRDTSEEETGRAKPATPRRKRPADPDPPELAARAGEVDLKAGRDRDIGTGPSIVVDDALELELEAVPRHVDPGKTEPSRELSGEISSRSDISVDSTGDDSAPVMIHESLRPTRIEDEPSAPILLDRKRPSEPPAQKPAVPIAVDDDSDDDDVIVELAARKQPAVAAPPTPAQPTKRPDRRTEIGIGIPVPPPPRAHRDTVEGAPAQLEDDPTGEHAIQSPVRPDGDVRFDDTKLALLKHANVGSNLRAIEVDPTRLDSVIAPSGDDASSDQIAAPPAPVTEGDQGPLAAPPATGSTRVPPPSGRVELSNVKRAPSSPDDEDDKPTITMATAEVEDLLDDDEIATWGAPGQTIPPPYLGAIPGIVSPSLGVIPIADVDSQPLMVAPPSPPEHRAHTNTEAGVARALEQATVRVLDLIRDLGDAQDRDEVVAVMIAHLAENHRRAGFFAVRNNEMYLFSITPNVVPLPVTNVRIDRPSTLADIVGTRLPYRGPMHDEVSRIFLQSILGVCPPEILLVPITVRERVVGVLFGEHRLRHTFDDQLALASRAAGNALERILKAKRG